MASELGFAAFEAFTGAWPIVFVSIHFEAPQQDGGRVIGM